jgi:hypothetical protein
LLKKKKNNNSTALSLWKVASVLEDERERRTRELRRSFPPEVSALPATQSQTLVVKTTTASHQRLVGGYQKTEQEPEGMWWFIAAVPITSKNRISHIRTPDQTPAVIRVILRVFICGSQAMKEQVVTKKRVQLKKN